MYSHIAFERRNTKMKDAFSKHLLFISMLWVTAFGLHGCSNTEKNVTLFHDVTVHSGLDSYIGITHGAAWGDFDRDGLPDVYVTNHLNGAKLFRNLGKGRFSNVTDTLLGADGIEGDKHGAAWGDINNDGWLDLIQLTGAGRGVGLEPKRLFLNHGAKLDNVAEQLGVANPYGRTRMPLWFDLNGDGALDLFQGAEMRFDARTPPFIFMQHDGKFVETQEFLKFTERTIPFCIITALNGNDHPNWICRVAGEHLSGRVFDMSTRPPHELDPLPHTAFSDIAAADFDNDGFIDLFLARKNPPGPVAFGQPVDNLVIADIRSDKSNADKPLGFRFRTSGKLNFKLASAWPGDALTPEKIHIGKQGVHPRDFSFTLSPDTADAAGLAEMELGKETGAYIGMPAPGQWELHVSSPHAILASNPSHYQQIQIQVQSTQPISDIQSMGETTKSEEAPARLLMNRDGKLVEESDKRGANQRIAAGVNVVAGDFNNDMYEDVFVVASGDIGKQENLLLLNRGDGHFNVVRKAGGAAGDHVGVGDSVTTADYDGDGFLDLLVSTGGSMGRSLGLPSENGAYHLYHNVGNGNHWIEIDLEGTRSNRDGIGAVVRLSTGGVNQVRVQDGGVHERGQNHARLHFGLAKHTRIDKIAVHWPSGAVQELSGVAADQVLRIKEPAGDKAD